MRKITKDLKKTIKRAVFLLILLPLVFPLSMEISFASTNLGEPAQGFNLNSELEGTSNKWSFIQISDLHIGEGYEDYGTAGYDDSPPAGDEGTSAQRLREAVNWVNANAAIQNIRLVVITGDITDSAEKSEFMKAKEILDSLQIPYVPILGNHDIWPYTQSSEAPSPFGDEYFKNIFSEQFEKLKNTLPNWDDGTRLEKIWNGEFSCDSYFQNYAFDYAGYHFICNDFNTRQHALAGSKGAMPYTNLYDFEGGTWHWYKNHLKDYDFKAARNIVNLTHQPLCVTTGGAIFSFCFSQSDYDEVTEFLYQGTESGVGEMLPYYKFYQGLWIAGHMHEHIPIWGPEFEFEIKYQDNYICPGVHTQAVKDDPSHMRLVKVWDKTDIPSPDGVLLYENEGYKGKGEFFTTLEDDLSGNMVGNKTASSALIRGSGTAEIFEGTFCSGNVLETSISIERLSDKDFDNRASSVRFDYPLIDDVSPSSGERGKSVPVEIQGKRFKSGLLVWLQNDSGYLFGKETTVSGSTKIDVKFDLTNAKTGKYDLAVINPNGVKNMIKEGFTVTESQNIPKITSISPDSGPVGIEVTITGQHFGDNPKDESYYVDFNGIKATHSSWSDTQIVCTVPSGAKTGGVKVHTEYGESNPYKFTVTSQTPVVPTEPSKTWYLAEGSTGGGFETFILVQNPGNEEAKVSLKFQTPSGEKDGPSTTLKPKSRQTFNVKDYVPDEMSVSTVVTSDKPVIAERAMYWLGRKAGHDSTGVTSASKTWYLAEGSTGGGFETWVLVQNPNDAPAKVSVFYQTAEGEKKGPEITLAPKTRQSISVANTVPENYQVSTRITSNKEIIAERAMYWNNRLGGHDSTGVTSPSKTWYLAEGSTAGGFETWVLIQNPLSTDAKVGLTLMTEKGKVPGPEVKVPKNSRLSVNVGEICPDTWDVSTKVTSNNPVIAERAMYWSGRIEGHDSVGVISTSPTWYLSEGSTAGGFETWALVQNPNTDTVKVTLTFMTPSGEVKGPTVDIQGNSRKSFNVGDLLPDEWSVSTKVSANKGIIVERAMYWNSRTGGHECSGVP
ncbi:MAG: IPT/TIG domain-containing protein, partial [Actinomycetota bacterium]|nr:IPT/TIG domain-containing protein [Actinomycetota bacterium]